MAAPAENWDAEATQNPENNFSLYATTSQSVQRPKTAFFDMCALFMALISQSACVNN